MVTATLESSAPSSCMTRAYPVVVSPAPPWLWGTCIPKRPSSFRPFSTSSGIRCSRSMLAESTQRWKYRRTPSISVRRVSTSWALGSGQGKMRLSSMTPKKRLFMNDCSRMPRPYPTFAPRAGVSRRPGALFGDFVPSNSRCGCGLALLAT